MDPSCSRPHGHCVRCRPIHRVGNEMSLILFLLAWWYGPLPPKPRPPGTIGVVCLYSGECAGPRYVHDVGIGIMFLEKSEDERRLTN